MEDLEIQKRKNPIYLTGLSGLSGSQVGSATFLLVPTVPRFFSVAFGMFVAH